MSNDFYTSSIQPHAGIIIKICRAYTDTQEDFEDYYQEVCLQIWKSRNNFKGQSEWSTWVYRLSLNVSMTLLKKRKNNQQYTASDLLVERVTEEPMLLLMNHSIIFTAPYDNCQKLTGL